MNDELPGVAPPDPTPLGLPPPRRRPGLPIAPLAEPARRRLPLAAGGARDVDRAHRPIYCVWEITLRCDLACHHCGSRAGRARPDELTTEEALDFVRQLAELKTTEVTLIGGEAYLREDWDVIARAIVDRGMVCSMTTGGRGLTLERAKRARDAGMRSVSVSLDGLEATHDRLRGVRGSFASAMEAIANVRAVGLLASVNTQICRANLDEIPSVFERLADAGATAWQMQITAAMGRAADQPELLLEPYQMLDVLPMLAALKLRGDARGVRLWPGNNIGYFGPHEATLRGMLPFGHMSSCGAGRLTLGVEANGDVKGCPSLPTDAYVGGNVRDYPLSRIWEETAALRITRDRTVDDLWGFCRDCYYAETCMAGCTWTSHVLLGRAGNNPYCHHRALELLSRGQRERVELVEQAPGAPFDAGRYAIVLEDWPEDDVEAAKARYLANGARP